MRALVLATTALAAITLAVPSRADHRPRGGDRHRHPDQEEADIEAAYATLLEQYRQMPLEAIYDPLLDQVIGSKLLLAEANKQNLARESRRSRNSWRYP